jgi:hypothetical protein
MKHTRVLLLVSFALSIPFLSHAQKKYEGAPIHYTTANVTNCITKLQTRISDKQIELEYKAARGYLESLLKELDVPISSQILVYSKTSLQDSHISPENPRAVYFNDEVYVGYIPGAPQLEISAVDPRQGPAFYVFPQKEGHPDFVRQDHECLRCHQSTHTDGIPGHIVRSVFSDDKGFPIYRNGSFSTDHTSPMHQRWGGWYVTGMHGFIRHMGNTFATEDGNEVLFDYDVGANLLRVNKRIGKDHHLTRHSDIVALMVLEHQTLVHNRITEAGFETREALYRQQALRDQSVTLSTSSRSVIQHQATKLVKAMLFHNEAKLVDDIQGSSSYSEDFSTKGIKDKQGRSLRDLDLTSQGRLFLYPCSFLIHSKSFDALPPPLLREVYAQLYDALTSKTPGEAGQQIAAEKRSEILEILRDTKTGLPTYWGGSK